MFAFLKTDKNSLVHAVIERLVHPVARPLGGQFSVHDAIWHRHGPIATGKAKCQIVRQSLNTVGRHLILVVAHDVVGRDRGALFYKSWVLY